MNKSIDRSKNLNNLIFIIKKKNISFQYLAVVNEIFTTKLFTFNLFFYKNIIVFLTIFLNKQNTKGLVRFDGDFFLIICLKKKFYFSKTNCLNLEYTKGLISFLHPCVSRLNRKSFFLFSLCNLSKLNTKINIEEFLEFKDTEEIGINIITETKKTIKLVDTFGTKALCHYTRFVLNCVFRFKPFIYYFQRKEKKIAHIHHPLNNRKKNFFNFKQNIERIGFGYTVILSKTKALFCFTNIFFQKNFLKMFFCEFFKSYFVKKWIPGILYLKISLLELIHLNDQVNFLQRSNRKTDFFSKFLSFKLKKILYNYKIFPHKFYNYRTKLYHFLSFLNHPLNFFSEPSDHYVNQKFFTFFLEIFGSLISDRIFYKSIKKKNQFNIKYALFSHGLFSLKIITKLAYGINGKILHKSNNINKNNKVLPVLLTDGALVLSVSFFFMSNFSKKIKTLIMDSVAFYSIFFFVFRSDFFIWKNTELATKALIVNSIDAEYFLKKNKRRIWESIVKIFFSSDVQKEKNSKKKIKHDKKNTSSNFEIYSKKKILEILLLNCFDCHLSFFKTKNYFYLKKIIFFTNQTKMDFLFYTSKNLLILFSFVLGRFAKIFKFKLAKILNNLQNVLEKKVQKVYLLSMLVLIFAKTSNTKIAYTIILEYKKCEKKNFSKIRKILLKNNLKKYLFNQHKNIPKTINSCENEKTFAISRIFAQIIIMGISILTLNDSVALYMTIRIYNHFLAFCNSNTKAVISSIVGLFGIFDNSIEIYDFTIKLINDKDSNVTKNAIFSLGIIGTNYLDTRISILFKCLIEYYSNKVEIFRNNFRTNNISINISILKLKNLIIVIRIAQGLVHILRKKNGKFFLRKDHESNHTKIICLVYLICDFSYSKSIGYNSVSIVVFLLNFIFKPVLFIKDHTKILIKSIKLKK